MNRIHISTALLAAVLGVVATAPKAAADDYNKKVIATFSEAVEVPGGVTLQPGTYVFKLQDSQNDRHIVLIQNQRENHTFAQVFATNDFRLVPKGKVQFRFWETPAGQPKALRAMFWPGDRYGQAFMYKRGRATQITQAQTTHEEVPVEPSAEPSPAPTPQQPAAVAQNTPPPAPEAAPAPVEAAPAPTPAPEQAPALVAQNTPPPTTLPQTASNMPLLALLGFLSVGISFVLGAFVKRVS
ncbi:MAG TPA: LPXTG cell wall anchor domain-containing protein [Bryobacteraceae bacterium]|jgi:LPXTG-motif cell wall-anchored protein|nr:LPXTG cell wall anchor domain-containing protein [Bryobacteraceae bacterium]